MRVEVHPHSQAGRVVFVAAIYSTSGAQLGCGTGATEEGARYSAVQNWAILAAQADTERVRRRARVAACVCDVGVVSAPWDSDECYNCGGC